MGFDLKPAAVNTELRDALFSARSALVTIALLSGALNFLLLGGSLYLMLVYDSVLPSHSLPTLFGLLIMVIIVYIFQAMFDILRSRMLSDVGAHFDQHLSERVQDATFQSMLRHNMTGANALTPMRDLDNIRAFLSTSGPAAFMDLPWIIFFMAILALLHVWLAVTALAGAVIMVLLTLLTSRMSARPNEQLSRMAGVRSMLSEEIRRHAELIFSMGMQDRMQARWQVVNRRQLMASENLVRTSVTMGGASRVFRMLLQSVVLTVGALLVMNNEASGGVIFASSIISARALAPIDQVIGNWKGFAAARTSWKRLTQLFTAVPERNQVYTILPRPERELQVEGLVAGPPGSQRATIQNVNFRLGAGDVLGIIGPSGSGKSSLVRAIVGAWRPLRGFIRLDGATLDQFDPAQIGGYMGYLPQTVELLSGTVADNISRFDPNRNSEAIVAAARAANAHDLIVSLPNGYDTDVGQDGDQLSAGQRQRIALARALYQNPFLIVLDEPNSNLDGQGEQALDQAIKDASARGAIVIIIAHRSSAINQANLLMYIRNGVVEAYGPKDEILARIFPNAPRVETAKAQGAA